MPVHPESFHDPNIIYVGEPTTLPANAAPPVDVYVADLSEDNAFRIAANTGVKTPIPGASYAFALASDRSGNVFLAEPGNLGVIKLPAGGGPETILADGLVQPDGVAVDWADNVYTVGKTLDAGSTFKALKIPADGGPPIVIWTETERIPSAIAVDIPGNVYIYTEHQTTILPIAVVKIPADGGPEIVINVARNDAGNAFAVDPSGQHVYFGDGDQIVKVPVSGGPPARLGTNLRGASGVAVDAAGNVYITDLYNNRIVQIPADSGPQVTIGRTRWPVNVAVQPTLVFNRHPPNLIRELLGGLDRDGGTGLVIGNHFIPIPPRSPVMSIIAQAAAPYLARAIESPELGEHIRTLK